MLLFTRSRGLLLVLLGLAGHAAVAQKTYLHCGRLLDVRAGRLLSQRRW